MIGEKDKMSDLSLKAIKEEYEIERQKDEVFNMESFLKRNEEKLQKVKEWEKTQKFVSSFEDHSNGDKND